MAQIASTEQFTLSGFLREKREDIFREWEVRARVEPKARPMSRLALLDHVPELIDHIAQVAEAQADQDIGATRAPDIHALERLDQGYDLIDVVQEFSLLREVILELMYADHRQMQPNQYILFNKAIDFAVARSVERYARARERTMRALDRIADLSSRHDDIAGNLPRLLQVLMETTAAVDSVVVFLRDHDALRAHAAAGVDEREWAGWRIDVGSGPLGGVAADKQPRMWTRADAADPLWQRIPQTRVHYAVPLLGEGDALVGIASMGSRSAFEFSEEDRQLLRVLASRVTAILAQHARRVREDQLKSDRDLALRALSSANAQIAHEQRVIELVLETIPLGIFLAGPDGDLLLTNEAAKRIWGDIPKLGLAGYGDFEGYWANGGGRLKGEDWALSRAVRNGQASHAERIRIRSFDGTEKLILNWAVPIKDGDGRILGGIAVNDDITAQAERDAKLREAEQRFKLVVEGIQDYAIIMLDPEGYIRSWNPGARALTGYGADEIIGESFATFIPPEEIDEGVPRKILDEAIRTGRAEIEGWRVRRNGKRFFAQVTVTALRDDHEQLVGFAWMAQDITDRKTTAERAERDARFQEQFMAILGHDLRNPLNAITASAEVLFRRGGLSEAQIKAINRISNTARRMGRMINDLLDLTRSRLGGGIPIAARRANLHDVAHYTVEELEVANPHRQIILNTRGEGWGEFDPDRMSQVLSNLVGNALEHGREGTPVKVSVSGSVDELSIDVTNEGASIPADVLPLLFDPYHRAAKEEATSRGQGLGLGLFIASEVVEAHQGKVSATSDEKLTTFSVRIPRRQPGGVVSE